MEGDFSGEIAQSPKLETQFIKNDAMESVCQELQNSQFYLNEALMRYDSLISGKQNSEIRERRGTFGEVLTEIALEHAASNNPQIQLDPIQNGATTENYRFRVDRDNQLTVTDRKIGNDITDYDQVFLVNSKDGPVPVVIEVKIQENDRHEKAKRRLAHLVRDGLIDQRLAPLREYFGTEKIGYILLANKDFEDSKHPDFEKFKQRGGIITFLPLSVDEITSFTQQEYYAAAA